MKKLHNFLFAFILLMFSISSHAQTASNLDKSVQSKLEQLDSKYDLTTKQEKKVQKLLKSYLEKRIELKTEHKTISTNSTLSKSEKIKLIAEIREKSNHSKTEFDSAFTKLLTKKQRLIQ